AQASSHHAAYVLVFQDLAQVRDEALIQDLLTNSGLKIVLGGIGDTDSTRFSKLFGTHERLFRSQTASSGRGQGHNQSSGHSQNSGSSHRGATESRQQSVGWGLIPRSRPDFTPTELRQLRDHHAVVERRDNRGHLTPALLIHFDATLTRTLTERQRRERLGSDAEPLNHLRPLLPLAGGPPESAIPSLSEEDAPAAPAPDAPATRGLSNSDSSVYRGSTATQVSPAGPLPADRRMAEARPSVASGTPVASAATQEMPPTAPTRAADAPASPNPVRITMSARPSDPPTDSRPADSLVAAPGSTEQRRGAATAAGGGTTPADSFPAPVPSGPLPPEPGAPTTRGRSRTSARRLRAASTSISTQTPLPLAETVGNAGMAPRNDASPASEAPARPVPAAPEKSIPPLCVPALAQELVEQLDFNSNDAVFLVRKARQSGYTTEALRELVAQTGATAADDAQARAGLFVRLTVNAPLPDTNPADPAD
ncbi:MAG TPA: hypothetical protein VFM49_27015, partial [Chloroflexia bacterium]|nr:hypothetical protein [Chloroflexia bacterium]